MSASLVGSEMCIRDRFIMMQSNRDLAFARRFDPDMEQRLRDCRDRHDPCLLYTSDAADDM
eukprot:7740550-Alexandrium_andersonii.AAC.1